MARNIRVPGTGNLQAGLPESCYLFFATYLVKTRNPSEPQKSYSSQHYSGSVWR